jgi:peptidoglycan/xylan/chitin deacetylase (PgdA/CDA1 family)
MSQKLALALSLALNLQLALSAAAHNPNNGQKRAPSPTLVERGPPYPTGSGYDPVPLSSIVPLSPEYSSNTLPVPTTYPPGSKPPIANAPVIPSFSVAATKWPTDWTLPPPTDSAEVKEWLKELEGVTIPDIPLNKKANGSNGVICGDNPDGVKNAGADKNCWWTCGSCVRDDDISTCKNKLTWGHTYDDGPGLYTNKLLTYLNSKDLKATFFLVGPRVITRPEIVVYEHMNGHELGVHTWSHPALTTLTNEQIVAELGWCRKAIKEVAGVTPILFRPPYGDIDDRVRAIAKAMNLVPALWTSIPDDNGDGVTEQWDSNDWRVHGGTVPAVANQVAFNTTLAKSLNLNTGFIVLQHDIYSESVDLAIGTTIPNALGYTPPFKMESVQVCQGDPIGSAYIETTVEALPKSNQTIKSSTSTTTASSNSPTKTGRATQINPLAPLVTLGLGVLVLGSLLL